MSALLAAISVLTPSAQGRARFFGIVPQAPLRSGDFARLGRAGLGLRTPVFWYEVEPRPGEYEFGELDRVFAEAAAHAVPVLPELGGSPSWVASDPARPPLGEAGLADWNRFVARLVRRYGPRGTFWVGRADRAPVRRWQIWNEPNFGLYWKPRPSPRGYVHLLRESARTIRRLDPGALVVAGGLAPIERQPWPWEFLRRMYRIPGARGAFDVAALHPYTGSVRGVESEVRRTRRVMARAGDGSKPLLLTELGAPSAARSPTSFELGPYGQADFLERVFGRLYAKRRRWRLSGVYWFTWRDSAVADPTCVFCQYAGLFDRNDRPKPAWWALRRTVGRFAGNRVR